MQPTPELLQMLRAAFIETAAPEFACCPIMYRQMRRFEMLPSPLWNHCTAVAFVIRGLFGGDYVSGKVKDEPHFWNRLPDGTELDMTSCQYGGDGFKPLRKGRKVRNDESRAPMHAIEFGLKVRDVLKARSLP